MPWAVFCDCCCLVNGGCTRYVFQLQPLWKGVLSAEEREEGKTALSELARRSQFMRNPRYKTSSFSNTAASGAARDGRLAEVNR